MWISLFLVPLKAVMTTVPSSTFKAPVLLNLVTDLSFRGQKQAIIWPPLNTGVRYCVLVARRWAQAPSTQW